MTKAKHIELRQVISNTTRHVFATMLSMRIRDTLEHALLSMEEERVVASVGFGGDGVAGGLSIHVTSQFAAVITGALLNPNLKSVRSSGDINDVLSELANVIGGNFVAALSELGYTCELGLPSVTRGVGLQTETGDDSKRECVSFEHEQDRFFISLDLEPG